MVDGRIYIQLYGVAAGEQGTGVGDIHEVKSYRRDDNGTIWGVIWGTGDSVEIELLTVFDASSLSVHSV